MRIFLVFIWILTGLTAGVIASDKGHGFGSWTLVGLLLGPLGLIAAAGLSDQKLREYIRRIIDPQFTSTNKRNKYLLKQDDLYINSSPKLLKEGSNDFQNKKQNYVSDFQLEKNSSDHTIWLKIIEMLEFRNPDLVYLADKSKSNTVSSSSGGKAYIIRDSSGEKIALAYTKTGAKDSIFHWLIKIY